MFILNTTEIPTTLQSLTTALEAALRSWITFPPSARIILGSGELPALTTLSVDVSTGRIAAHSAHPIQSPSGALLPGPTIEKFSVAGHPVLVSDIPVHLDLTATKATFAYARAPDQKLIATLQDAAHGQLQINLPQADLNAAALQVAREFAGDKVTIQSINVGLTSVSPTEVNVLLTITAKKFVTAIVKVSGRIAIDNQMIATAKNLKASADGMVGNIAVGLIQPHLQQLEGKPLPLMAFSLGNVKLRGMNIETTTGLKISAAFGSEPA